MKRAKYLVYGMPNGEIARFSNSEHALQFARQMSKIVVGGYWDNSGKHNQSYNTVEVGAPDGLIAQFCAGAATPEFAHLDKAS